MSRRVSQNWSVTEILNLVVDVGVNGLGQPYLANAAMKVWALQGAKTMSLIWRPR